MGASATGGGLTHHATARAPTGNSYTFTDNFLPWLISPQNSTIYFPLSTCKMSEF